MLADRLDRTVRALLDWAEQSPVRAAILISAVALLVILPGLAAMPVTDRDEARFAQASKQMLETGDLIDIRFQDQPRWKKPVGIYWLQAASVSIFGGTDAGIWAYRLPSAIGAWLAALLTAWAVRPLAGARTAVLSGLMVATCVLFVGEANIAKTDAALLASAVAVFGGLVHAFAGRAGPWTALVFWLGIAASILLKGPIVPAIAVLALVACWIANRKAPPFRALYPVAGLLLTLALVAPWLIAIWQVSDGAFFAESLGRDMGGKMVSGQEKHWGPPGLYLGIVWATFWPWAAMIPLALGALWARRRTMVVLIAAAWVIPFWIIVEAVPTKLPHYVLPLYPALAMALAFWVTESAERPNRRWPYWCAAIVFALPGGAMALAALVLPVILEGSVIWAALPLVVIGLVAVVVGVRASLQGQTGAMIGAGLLAAVTIYPAVLQFSLPSLQTGFASNRLASVIQQYRPCSSGPAYSIGYREPSLVFLTETETRLVTAGEAFAALTTDPGAMMLIEHRWKDRLADALPSGVVRTTIQYFNYNRGKFESADLMTQDDPRWDACSGQP